MGREVVVKATWNIANRDISKIQALHRPYRQAVNLIVTGLTLLLLSTGGNRANLYCWTQGATGQSYQATNTRLFVTTDRYETLNGKMAHDTHRA